MDDILKTQNILPIVTIIIVFLILFIPNYNIAHRSTVGGVGGAGFYQWHESLTWMQNNTPEPGIDFNAIYDRPEPGKTFKYPDTAYGVMSWWDYGHVITCFAHRIPNANPFQNGIGGRGDAPGASTFFTAQSEEEATQVLIDLGMNDNIGSRYIVSDAYMAYGINDVMAQWNDDMDQYRVQVLMSGKEEIIFGPRWYTNMESRLHIMDGNGLEQYRLVHESIPNPNTRGGAYEKNCKAIYNFMYEGDLIISDTGYIKIFEHVPGATLRGTGENGKEITLSIDIETNQNRTFKYEQVTTIIDDTFTFTVPYSTSGPVQGETNFDTKPATTYVLMCEGMVKTVEVSEEDVLSGNTISC